MKKPILVVAIAGALLVTSILVSPYFALHQMKSALDNKDADKFSEYVDFPALRENFKGQMMIALGEKFKSPDAQDPLSGLGQTLATAFINPMISPAGVIAMMHSGTPQKASTGIVKRTVSPDTPEKAPDFSLSYKAWDKVVVKRAGSTEPSGGFFLKRHGLWSWKLAAVEFPAVK